jgi:putative membrane protein
MFTQMKPFFLRWLVTTLAVAVAVPLTGMYSEGWAPLVCMALVLGVINAVVRPVLLILGIPFIVLTLGLFIPILNALLFWLASKLVPGFVVDGFWQAFFGALIVSVVNWSLSSFFRTAPTVQYQVVTPRRPIAEPGEKVVHGRVVGE